MNREYLCDVFFEAFGIYPSHNASDLTIIKNILEIVGSPGYLSEKTAKEFLLYVTNGSIQWPNDKIHIDLVQYAEQQSIPVFGFKHTDIHMADIEREFFAEYSY